VLTPLSPGHGSGYGYVLFDPEEGAQGSDDRGFVHAEGRAAFFGGLADREDQRNVATAGTQQFGHSPSPPPALLRWNGTEKRVVPNQVKSALFGSPRPVVLDGVAGNVTTTVSREQRSNLTRQIRNKIDRGHGPATSRQGDSVMPCPCSRHQGP